MPKYLLFIVMLLVSVTIAGGFYKWVDEQGRTVYSDTPPPGKAAQQVDLPPEPPKAVLERAQQNLEKQRDELQRRKQPQEVLGTIALGFAPTVLASLPVPPIDLTIVIRPLAGGSNLKFKVVDPSPLWEVEKADDAVTFQNFSFSLRPGSYRIDFLEVESQSLSNAPFSLVTGGPQFTVPEGNCVYVGRITFVYMRLPPGSNDQAVVVVQQMAKKKGKPFLLHYLRKGALVGVSTAIDTPSDTEEREELKGKRIFKQAREKNCAVQLANF